MQKNLQNEQRMGKEMEAKMEAKIIRISLCFPLVELVKHTIEPETETCKTIISL